MLALHINFTTTVYIPICSLHFTRSFSHSNCAPFSLCQVFPGIEMKRSPSVNQKLPIAIPNLTRGERFSMDCPEAILFLHPWKQLCAKFPRCPTSVAQGLHSRVHGHEQVTRLGGFNRNGRNRHAKRPLRTWCVDFYSRI